MDNYYAMTAVLQMAKAWSNLQTAQGYVSDVYDEEALLIVERMLNEVEGEKDEA